MMRFQQLVRQLAFGVDGISIFFIKGLQGTYCNSKWASIS